jgi:hypothetical protein
MSGSVHPKGYTKALLLRAIQEAGAAGIGTDALATASGTSYCNVTNALRGIKADGLVCMVRYAWRTPAMWYAPEHAPQQPARARGAAAGEAGAQASKALRLDPAAPAIVPPGLRVQVLPCGRDMRFSADPAIAGRGAISQDWMLRRQQGGRLQGAPKAAGGRQA